MSGPTVRDEILRAWASILVRNGCKASHVDALTAELAQACEGRGVHLPRRPRIDDPNTVGLQKPPPEAVRRAEDSVNAAAARAALRPYGGVDARADHQPADHLPDIPEETE